jgi:hypothetical protein
VEINGAIRDVLELTRDEVTKNGVSFSKRCDAMAKGDREVPLHVFLRRPTPRVRRAPRWLTADGRDAHAHSVF